jgi:hypothetical protein
MPPPTSILEQILEEQRAQRAQQSAIIILLKRQVRLLGHIAGEEKEVERELEEIERDLAPEAISLTYDLSATPFAI